MSLLLISSPVAYNRRHWYARRSGRADDNTKPRRNYIYYSSHSQDSIYLPPVHVGLITSDLTSLFVCLLGV